MVKWSGSRPEGRTARKRHRAWLSEEVAWRRRWLLRSLKDKLDLYGEDSLNREEREIVRLFPDFFYPERG